jgi:hypothetical protein
MLAPPRSIGSSWATTVALGDRQFFFGIVSMDRERVREIAEGERIVGAGRVGASNQSITTAVSG